jgi:hypothetical protein
MLHSVVLLFVAGLGMVSSTSVIVLRIGSILCCKTLASALFSMFDGSLIDHG